MYNLFWCRLHHVPRAAATGRLTAAAAQEKNGHGRERRQRSAWHRARAARSSARRVAARERSPRPHHRRYRGNITSSLAKRDISMVFLEQRSMLKTPNSSGKSIEK